MFSIALLVPVISPSLTKWDEMNTNLSRGPRFLCIGTQWQGTNLDHGLKSRHTISNSGFSYLLTMAQEHKSWGLVFGTHPQVCMLNFSDSILHAATIPPWG